MMVGAGLIDPSSPDGTPSDGFPGLMQEYLRRNKMVSD